MFFIRKVYFCVVLLGLMLSSLCAKTIGWWSMDGVPGEEVVSVPERSGSGASAAVLSHYPDVTDVPPPVFTPTDHNLFVDPVAGLVWTNETVLSLSLEDETKIGNGYYLTVADDPVLTRPASFTVEAFFKSDAFAGEQWHAIACKPNSSKDIACDSWGIRQISRNTVTARFSANGLRAGNQTVSQSVPTRFADGRWHHVALTVDATENPERPIVKFYLDYGTPATLVLTNPVYYTDHAICIGGNSRTAAAFFGGIDEVRISDRALDVTEFLGFKNLMADESDVAVWLGENDWFGPTGYQYNAVGSYTNLVRIVPIGGMWVCPSVTNETAGALIYPEAGGAGILNPTAMRFTGKSYYEIADPGQTIATSDFTVECFFKNDGAQVYTPLLRQKNARNVAWNLGFNDQGLLRAIFTYSTGTERTMTCMQSVTDGKWHHVAFVYSKTNQTASLYVDRKLCGTLSNLTQGIELSDTYQNLYVGGDPTNGSMYKGLMDEVRITRRVLRPSEFLWNQELLPKPVFEEGETIAHWRFDDTLGVTNFPGWFEEGEGSVVIDGGVLPSYSTNVPNAYVLDGEEGAVLSQNQKVLAFQKSRVVIPASELLEQGRMTVECFFRTPGVEQWAGLIRYNANAEATQPYWAISFIGENNQSRVMMRVDTPTRWNQIVGTSRVVADGKWHHVAVMYEPYEKTNTMVRIFLDYQIETEQVVEGIIEYENTYGTANPLRNLMLGASSSTTVGYEGDIDELRFSYGLLPVTRFLRVRAALGTMLILR